MVGEVGGVSIGWPWPPISRDGEEAMVVSTSSISCWLMLISDDGGNISLWVNYW